MRTQVQRLGSRTNEEAGLDEDRWGQVMALDPDLQRVPVIVGHSLNA